MLKKGKSYIRKNLSKIYRYSKIYDDGYKIQNFIKANKINLVLDIGANSGQYAMSLRRFGYKNQIVSFEPLNKCYQELLSNSAKDKLWSVYEKCALGSANKEKKINISENLVSSSIKKIKKCHLNLEPKSRIIGKENINIKKLDSIGIIKKNKKKNILLKIDTQGYEYEVLRGSNLSLKYIKAIQIELSLKTLYDNQPNWLNLLKYLENKKFKVFGFLEGFKNKKTDELMQLDCMLFKI